MKASELKNKSEAELQEELMSLLREQFSLRMQSGTGQLTKTHLVKQARRNVALVKTMLNEKKRNAS